MDVVMINRYYGWYSDSGHSEVVPYQLSYDLDNWYQVRKKPVWAPRRPISLTIWAL